MTVVGFGTVERTFIQAVNKVLLSTGKNETATLVGSVSNHVKLAMDAVQEARDRVFYRTKWNFRRGFWQLELVANQMWYELPADYQRLGSPISLNRQDNALIEYVDYEKLIAMYPDLRAFPPGAGVGDIGTVVQLLDQTHNFGESKICTRVDDYIGLMPIPNSDFVDLEDTLFSTYWKQASPLQGDQDDIGLPREMWECHNLLALAKFRKSLEFSDWGDDWKDGMKQLMRLSGESKEPQDNQVYHATDLNYNE